MMEPLDFNGYRLDTSLPESINNVTDELLLFLELVSENKSDQNSSTSINFFASDLWADDLIFFEEFFLSDLNESYIQRKEDGVKDNTLEIMEEYDPFDTDAGKPDADV